MIDRIRGIALKVEPMQVILETGGIGFRLTVPLSTSAKVKQGKETVLLTELIVREDSMTLFGFHTEKERGVFNLLRGVAGVGPKLACTVLSGVSVEGINQAVIRGEPGLLAKVPGIGRKTSGRIVMELSGKLDGVLEGIAPVRGSTAEAIQALISLGYQRNVAARSVEKAARDAGHDAPVEDLIRAALKLSTGAGTKGRRG